MSFVLDDTKLQIYSGHTGLEYSGQNLVARLLDPICPISSFEDPHLVFLSYCTDLHSLGSEWKLPCISTLTTMG